MPSRTGTRPRPSIRCSCSTRSSACRSKTWSEGGGPFLGVEELSYLKDVYPGETLYARSEVIAKREAGNRPGFGIVTWHTRGANERGEEVVTFKRSNLVRMRG